jgi:cobalt-zinc-cadmium efflux system protein
MFRDANLLDKGKTLMTLLLRVNSNNSNPKVMRSCCDFSHLVDDNNQQSRQKSKYLWISLGLLISLFLSQLLIGLLSHSLSLLSEAGHLFSDVIALGISLIATSLAQLPAKGQATFGHRRVEILAALLNGLALAIAAIFIAKEALERFQSPEIVLGLPMLIVALAGLVVNGINLTLLHKISHNDLNIRGAFLHVVADTASSFGVILAALMVYFFNWTWVDAVVSLLIACSIILSALPLLKDSLEVLMEYAPRSVDPAMVEAALKSFVGVDQVQKLHIWMIGSNQVALCAHLTVEALGGGERDRLTKQIQTHLEQEFNINQSILQLTHCNSTEMRELHPLLNGNLMEHLNKSSVQEN